MDFNHRHLITARLPQFDRTLLYTHVTHGDIENESFFIDVIDTLHDASMHAM